MNRITGILFSILLVLSLFALSGCETKETSSGASGGRGGGSAVRIEAVVAQKQELQSSVRGVGILLPAQEVEIQSEMSGKIKTIYFKDGQKVKSGDVLVKLEDDELKAAVAKAYSKLVLSRSTTQRKRAQFDAGAISAQEWDGVVAELRSAEADSAAAAAALLKTIIWAPFSGTLGIGKVSLGERLSAGSPVVKITQKFPLKVDFSVAGKYAGVLKAGMAISLFDGGVNYAARITALDGSLDNSTRTLQARAVLEETGNGASTGTGAGGGASAGNAENLTAGAPIEFSLDLPPRLSFTVPPESIGSDALGSTIYIYKDGKAKLQRIEIGTRLVDRIEVVSGLAEGDTVLCVGASPIRDGGNVEISGWR
ncbi:MexH family multidrug efflux RND transporter periplasmic adaptor subunit [Fibrobacterales bacterium]|nr:MexH family multidrug efflux RND transporter periplasmic adaptor subunit [Fibrobacterales bacterium]